MGGDTSAKCRPWRAALFISHSQQAAFFSLSPPVHAAVYVLLASRGRGVMAAAHDRAVMTPRSTGPGLESRVAMQGVRKARDGDI